MSSVTDRSFTTESVDETVAALASAFRGARVRPDDPAERFRYGQRARSNGTVQFVAQDLRARLASDTERVGFVTVAWTPSGEARYSARGRAVRADGAVFWAGSEPLTAEVAHADLRAVTLTGDHFARRASALLGRDWAAPTDLVELNPGEHADRHRTALEATAATVLDDHVAPHGLVEHTATDLLVARVLTMPPTVTSTRATRSSRARGRSHSGTASRTAGGSRRRTARGSASRRARRLSDER